MHTELNILYKTFLDKLKIESLNQMQDEAIHSIQSHQEIILLSPTGTGKTLAFLLPLVKLVDADMLEVQALILAPSRELAIQIEQVCRDLGSGLKVNTVYGGQKFSKDLANLKTCPQILIGTPGRVADHIRRGTFPPDFIKTLIIDEFDKSLEIGFEQEMMEIIEELIGCDKRILTSATFGVKIPDFIKLENPCIVDYLGEGVQELAVKKIISPDKDKLDTLLKALQHFGNQPGIVFCNYKEGIQRISHYLLEHKVPHGVYHGSLDQVDRERALIKFRNGTHQLIIATDLASRGLDIPELKFIIHYHLPVNGDAYTHRNGRTARMNQSGSAYILSWTNDELPHFIPELEEEILTENPTSKLATNWETIFVSGGRKDKISKGDLAGFFLKKGQLQKEELGLIELKQDCAFVGVNKAQAQSVIQLLNNEKIKKRKVRVKLV